MRQTSYPKWVSVRDLDAKSTTTDTNLNDCWACKELAKTPRGKGREEDWVLEDPYVTGYRLPVNKPWRVTLETWMLGAGYGNKNTGLCLCNIGMKVKVQMKWLLGWEEHKRPGNQEFWALDHQICAFLESECSTKRDDRGAIVKVQFQIPVDVTPSVLLVVWWAKVLILTPTWNH